MTTQTDPRLVEAAKHDPTLAYMMITKGIPPTRERWIKLNWLGKHEMEVPAPWRDPSKVEA